jgi:hypothetical protein
LGLDLFRVRGTAILATTPFETADQAYAHVLIALDLAAEPHAGHTASRQDVSLRRRHLGRLASEKLDAASRAPSLATACVQLIAPHLFAKRCDQSLALRDIELAHSFYSQSRHDFSFSRVIREPSLGR